MFDPFMLQKIKDVTAALEKGKDLPLYPLIEKLKLASSSYPNDPTIPGVLSTLSKIANEGKISITRSDLNRVYDAFYGKNNKFGDVFASELGKEVKIAKTASTVAVDNLDLNKSLALILDKDLVKDVEGLFNKAEKLNSFSSKAVYNTKFVVKEASTKMGYNLTSLHVSEGNEKFLICMASFASPKGEVSVILPLELKGDAPKAITSFIGNDGIKTFTSENLGSYLQKWAGKKLNTSPKEVLNVFAHANKNQANPISDIDLAFLKLKKKAEPDHQDLLNQELAKVNENKAIFENSLSSNDGLANLEFGIEAVKEAVSQVKFKFNKLGFNQVNIKVLSSDKDKINFGVSLYNGSACQVPVKIASGRVIPPSVLIANGSILPLTNDSLSQLALTEKDSRLAAFVSPMHEASNQELINDIKKSVEEGNFAKAEDSLNVIASRKEELAYKMAFAVYTAGLSGKPLAKTASKENCGCSKVVRTKYSVHPVCGHTNLPIHKVAQDKNGNCIPKWRENLEEHDQLQNNMMTYKIFWDK